MAPRLVERGVDLDVAILFHREGVQDELVEAGAKIFPVALGEGRPRRVRKLMALMRDRRPDLVHTTLFESDVAGRIAARLAGTPAVSSFVTESYGPAHRSENG